MADTYEFVSDDYKASREFVLSLNRKIFRQRFSSLKNWEPDHLSLVIYRGEPVALADCMLASGGRSANASLVAKQGFGAAALAGLSHLKKSVGDLLWFSTLRAPTPATIAISRRYFHETYDQDAWDISNEIVSRHGPVEGSRPMPILMNERLRRELGLSAFGDLSRADRNELANAMQAPQQHQFNNSIGQVVPPIFTMAYGFDVFDVPMRVRQQVTRCASLFVAMSLGHQISEEEFGKLADMKLAATLNTYLKP